MFNLAGDSRQPVLVAVLADMTCSTASSNACTTAVRRRTGLHPPKWWVASSERSSCASRRAFVTPLTYDLRPLNGGVGSRHTSNLLVVSALDTTNPDEAYVARVADGSHPPCRNTGPCAPGHREADSGWASTCVSRSGVHSVRLQPATLPLGAYPLGCLRESREASVGQKAEP